MHTPGPWKHDPEVTDPQTLDTAPEVSAPQPNGSCRYICRLFGVAPSVIEETQANARLIASAPDLLAACKQVIAALSQPATYPADMALIRATCAAAIAIATQEPTR